MKYIHLSCRNPFLVIIPEIMNASNKIHGSSSRSIHNLTSFYGKVPKIITKAHMMHSLSWVPKQHTKSHFPWSTNFHHSSVPTLHRDTFAPKSPHKPQTNNCKELGRDAIYGPEWSRKWTSRQEIEGISFSHLYVQLSNDRNNQSLLWWTKHGINHLNVDSIAIQ